MPNTEQPKRRHAVVFLGIPDLAWLIDLPEGASIHHTYHLPHTGSLALVLESDSFDEVEYNAEAPVMHRGMRRYVMTDDDGVTWSRWAVA